MNRFTPITIENVFTPAECKRIISLGESLGLEDGKAYYPFEEVKERVNHSIRIAKSAMLPHNDKTRWIIDRCGEFIRTANKQFEFDISKTEPIEILFVKYPVGGHFGFHMDNLAAVSKRKISSSIQLSSEHSYEGGDLQVLLMPTTDNPRKQGCGTAFPSWALHKVHPVTKGIRYCMVVWAFGDNHFR